MRLLQAPRHDSSSHCEPLPLSSEPFAREATDDLPSRHDPFMFSARTLPVDPYTDWLARREADRRSLAEPGLAEPLSSTATSTPWYVVLARGCPDS
jgi:hypothetical protein